MHSLIAFATLLTLLALSDGSLVIDVPALTKPEINRDMVVVIQGLVILFMGALEYAFRPWVAALFFRAEEK